MASHSFEILPDEARIALAHSRPDIRGALRIFFELDRRLARIVGATTEPMLGQMRLAWWRDELAKPAAERPEGDVVLDGIGQYWAGREASLIPLVNAWEHLLAEPPLGEEDAVSFGTLRRDALLAVYGHSFEQSFEQSDAGQSAPAKAAWYWAMADLAANVSAGDERDLIVKIALSRGEDAAANAAAANEGAANEGAANEGAAIDKNARGLAVLGALGLRALKRGGVPLMEGRAASLIATRAAIFGK